MSSASKKRSVIERFTDFHDRVQEETPHLYRWLTEGGSFRGLTVVRQDDTTCLAVARSWGGEGDEVVLFASGYGALGALFTLDGAIQGDNWRKDKSWTGKGN